MSRIAILTLFYKNYNYGGQLQAFALQKKISNLNLNCEQACVDIKRRGKIYCLLREIKYSTVKTFFPNIRNLIKYIVKCSLSFKDSIGTFKRKKSFNLFLSKIRQSDKVYSFDNIKDISDKYDVFVVGSNCVWLQYNNKEIYLGD